MSVPKEHLIEGKLARAKEQARPAHLELEGHKLDTGHALDVCVQGHWIQGHIELGSFQDDAGKWFSAWYLDTNVDSDPSILLSPGVLARIDERW